MAENAYREGGADVLLELFHALRSLKDMEAMPVVQQREGVKLAEGRTPRHAGVASERPVGPPSESMIATPPVVTRLAFTSFLVACVLLCPSLIGCTSRGAMRTTPQIWQLRGSIVAIGNGSVEIRHKTGRVVTLIIDDRTTYARRHEPADKAALRRGVRVAIDVERTPQADRALHIELFGRAP